MLLLSQSPRGALCRSAYTLSSPTFDYLNHAFSCSKCKPRFIHPNRNKLLKPLLAKSRGVDGVVDSSLSVKRVSSSATSPHLDDEKSFSVHPDSVPLEGVIQLDRTGSSRLKTWGSVGLLAVGDVLALLLFSAMGRFIHGFSVFDMETFRVADPFIAGWFLSAYFLGGYGEDGRGRNGLTKAMLAAFKTWFFGIPVGLIIRAVGSGHLPGLGFVNVTIGSTALLLIGWRALSFNILGNHNKVEANRSGNPFEFFQLLSSLIKRW